jgi:hypothetical protein
MKTVTYLGTEATTLDVGEHGSFFFDPANGVTTAEMSDEAAAIVAASQPFAFEVSE